MKLNLGAVKELPAKFTQLFAKKTSAETTSAGSGYQQLILQILAFVIFAALALWALSHVRVNGPVYNELMQYQNLRADTLPPPMYPVDAFAALNEAYVASTSYNNQKRDSSIEKFKRLELAFNERTKFWKDNLTSPDLQGKLEAVVVANQNFYRIAKDEYLPAIPLGTVAASAPLGHVTEAFGVAETTAAQFTQALEKESRVKFDQQAKLVQNVLIGLIVIATVLLFLMVLYGRRQTKVIQNAVAQLENDGQQNQEAVLNLLDEMGDLADGDLTVKAVVRENIAGAIADSINYTINNLRSLVTEINHATEEVNNATTQAQTTSDTLLKAAEEQSKQIVDTGEAVSNMTRSILQVSSNASQATEVAQRSLDAATQGSQAVQNTITGMNEMRVQIQETSKRIKRLGESSQEISEIVELISDITEQTNILALNAAIQAASAGEAGRGFTVVAEEVQRLAERSSEATKQISAIVKTIQTDTNSAVAAMEKSTEGVVEGAKLSDAAGQALSEIEIVTTDLAKLIRGISVATNAQTEMAATVTKNMQKIQQITVQTTEGTKKTAASVGQLTNLAEDLRSSVSGFKLI